MVRLGTPFALEPKLSKFNEWEHTSSLSECRSECSLQRLDVWLVTAAAQVSGLIARQQRLYLGWSSGFTLCS